MNHEDVTIIIPYFGEKTGERYSFKECLTSLVLTCDCPIIIAKNGPYELEIPEEFLSRVEVFTYSIQGQCHACNEAAKNVKTDYLFITNDDMIYPPGWFEKLTEFIPSAPYRVCMSPQLVEPQEGAITFKQYFCGGVGGDFDKQKFLDYASNVHKPVEENNGIRKGFNLPFLLSKEVWDTIGGYDEAYDPWGSNGDSDLEYKIRLSGVQPYQNTNACVYHFGKTSGTFHPDNRSYWDHNWHYFIQKWGFERASSPTIWTADFPIEFPKLKYNPDWVGKFGWVNYSESGQMSNIKK